MWLSQNIFAGTWTLYTRARHRRQITTMASTPCSPALFRMIGEEILGHSVSGNSRKYVAMFGITPLKVHHLWRLIVEGDDGNDGNNRSEKKFAPNHLLWALLLLRSYGREVILATLVGVSEKTFRKWAWMMIEELARIENLVSSLALKKFFCNTKVVTTNNFCFGCLGKLFFGK